jgi:hypothetical protein
MNAALLAATFTSQPLSASHAWSGYQWNGSGLPVDLVVGDNLTTEQWAEHLQSAVADWNLPTGGATQSIRLDIGFGGTDPATCAPSLGRIEVCNWAYGETGWLGLAQVWAYRGTDKHIAQATTLLNDTYFADPFYDTSAWRQMVTCQEIACRLLSRLYRRLFWRACRRSRIRCARPSRTPQPALP